MNNEQELKELNEEISAKLERFREVNHLAEVHVLDHSWHQYDAEQRQLNEELSDLFKRRREIARQLAPKTQMKQCCYICENLDENICVEHSKGYEAVVRYPKNCGEKCRDFSFNEEFADEQGIELITEKNDEEDYW